MRRFWTMPSVVLLAVAVNAVVVGHPAHAYAAHTYHAVDLGTLGGG